MNRGDHQERNFSDDEDRRIFLATLEEACQKTAWLAHSFPITCRLLIGATVRQRQAQLGQTDRQTCA